MGNVPPANGISASCKYIGPLKKSINYSLFCLLHENLLLDGYILNSGFCEKKGGRNPGLGVNG